MAEMFSPSLPLEYFNVQTQRTMYLNPYSQQYIRNKSYAQRLQRGFARGISQSEARGHSRSARGLSESQERRARAEEAGGLSPYQVFLGGFERRYGFSYQYWRVLYRKYIKEINVRSWANAPSARMQFTDRQRDDPRLFPADVAEVKSLYDQGYRDLKTNSPVTWQEWVENRLAARLEAIVQLQDNHNPAPGRAMFTTYNPIWVRVAIPAEVILSPLATARNAPAIPWWWYH